MSAVASPIGLRPVAILGGHVYAGSFDTFDMTVNSTVGIFTGDLINLNPADGNPRAATASPTNVNSANSPIGVCVGVQYEDPRFGEVHAQYLPANAITNGMTKVKIKVAVDPNLVFRVQANGPVTTAMVGRNAGLTNFAGGSTATGNSGVRLDTATIIATGVGNDARAVRIIGFVNDAQSKPGDAFTDVLVVYVQGVHMLRQALLA